MILVLLGQAMMALPIMLPILFATAFAFAEIVLIIGSWVARISGMIDGERPEMQKKFIKISLWFALVICILSLWRMFTTELIN